MRYSKSYLYLLGLNSRNRYVYTGILSAFIFFAWLFFWYMPVEKQLTRLDRENNQLKKDSKNDLEQQASCKSLADRVTQLQDDLQIIAKDMQPASYYIKQLTAYVQDAHMRLISLRIAEQENSVEYKNSKINFEAIGTLSSITQFFNRLEEGHMFTQCDELSLHRQADDNFLLHCVLVRIVPDAAGIIEVKSPSTLKKAEGLGG